jgi:uncharacterized protein (TIGR02217 family)
VSPGFSTNIVTTISGHEKRNSDWADARMDFDVGPGIRSEDELRELIAFFRARRGAARGCRFRDPYDHSSRDMVGAPTPTDQFLGTGDGQQTAFALVKSYGGAEGEPQQRRITRPDPAMLQVAVDGQVTADWSLDPEGIVMFDSPPPVGSDVSAGFLFDVPVRFASDRLTVNHATFLAGDIPEVLLVEVREPS